MSDQKRIAFGYSRDGRNRIVIHPLQSQAVRLIFELYADGQSLEKISSQFLACGLPSPYNKPRWGKQALSKILSYERYLGNEDYPRIIEPDLFEHVMAVRQSRQK